MPKKRSNAAGVAFGVRHNFVSPITTLSRRWSAASPAVEDDMAVGATTMTLLHVRLVLIASLLCAASYAVFLVLPYYVNDLGRYPLDEVAIGYHDPKDLWPLNSGVGSVVWGLGGMFTIVFGPLVAICASLWALIKAGLSWQRLDARHRFALVGTAVSGLGIIAFVVSPFGQALTRWWLD
jgi:hypothetical protein